MAEKRRTTKVNIPMLLAAVLFCATLLSIHFTSGLYARYTTSGAGSDSARVIAFKDITITEEGDFNNETHSAYIIPGVDLAKKAVVEFGGSEAATYVFVEVKITPEDQWFLGADKKTFSYKSGDETWLEWKMYDSWNYLEESNGTYIFYQALAPNIELKEAIIANDGVITVSDAFTKTDIVTMTGIAIEFSATAVQSHGFESVSAAWDSIEAK